MFLKFNVVFTIALWLISNANGQSEAPRIVVSPSYHCANQTSSLSWTCIAYVGQEETYQPTSITWYNGANEELANSSQVTIYSNVVVIDGFVFIESTLEASIVHSHLTGQSSCSVSNAMGEDRASWTLIYDIMPPVTIIVKPASQIVNYTSTLRMTCLALVQQEVANDTFITWWGEFGQIANNTGSETTTIYSSRVWSEDMLFIESTLEICSVNYLHLGDLSCVAENALGRDVANWIVEPPVEYLPPQLSISQTSVRLNYGGMINVSCNASVGSEEAYDIDPSEIEWLDANGQKIMSISNQININTITSTDGGTIFMMSMLEIDSIEPQHVGNLQCVVKNIFGRDSANLTVQIYEILTSPELIITPLNQSVDCRSRVTITCAINAFPIPEVQWYFNSGNVDSGASDNVFINHYYGSLIGLNYTETYLDICDFGDVNVGYYWCSALNFLGNYTSDPVWIDIDPQTAPPVTPPVNIRADRTNNSEAMVRFEPQSLGKFEIDLYVANDSNTPYLVEKVTSVQATIADPRANFTGLNTCSRYWVVITGQYCTHRGSSDPVLVGLYSVNPYEVTLTLGSKDSPCKSWVIKDPEMKAADMEKGLLIPTSDCGYNIPCFEGSGWKCTDEDPLKVTFETQIVGYNQETITQIMKCIDDWIIAAKATGQSFTLGNSTLTVVSFEEPAPPGVSLPVWAWVVVGVGAILLLVCFVTVLFLALIVVKRRSHMPVTKKNQKLINSDELEEDDNDDHNDYTVAVVDNPLYAENEGDIDNYIKEELGEDEDELEVHDEDLTKTDI